MLRMMAWLCTMIKMNDATTNNQKICTVTGPNIEIAIKLIRRLTVSSSDQRIAVVTGSPSGIGFETSLPHWQERDITLKPPPALSDSS